MIFGKKEEELRTMAHTNRRKAEQLEAKYNELKIEHKKLQAILNGDRECSRLCAHCKHYLTTDINNAMVAGYNRTEYDCELNRRCKDFERISDSQ